MQCEQKGHSTSPQELEISECCSLRRSFFSILWYFKEERLRILVCTLSFCKEDTSKRKVCLKGGIMKLVMWGSKPGCSGVLAHAAKSSSVNLEWFAVQSCLQKSLLPLLLCSYNDPFSYLSGLILLLTFSHPFFSFFTLLLCTCF